MSVFKRTKSIYSSPLLSLPVDAQILIFQNLDPSTLLSFIKVSPSLWQVAHRVLQQSLATTPLRVSLIFHQANSWRFSAEFECKSCNLKTADLLFYPSQRVSVRYFHHSNKEAFIPFKVGNQEFLTPNLTKESKRYTTSITENSLSVQAKTSKKPSWKLTYTVTKKAFISFIPKICIGGQWLTPQEFICSPEYFFQQKSTLTKILQYQPKVLLQKLWKKSSGKSYVKEVEGIPSEVCARTRERSIRQL
ncbi:hypothetical protein K7432_015255 [Basidiobolus ranarum]|uniref:F-box domain-containing protein n=1 Tax=Basidiobolus ranarum TaxID=34480 RepID=A0ABR2WGD8_9FUNG